MKQFHYKELDEEGAEILETISKADKFNYWMYQTILPYCSGEILEIGSGIGNISKYFINDGCNITLSDIRANYCDKLSATFESHKNFSGVKQLDLVDPCFDDKYASLLEQFDTIFSLNVIEHIKDDQIALENCKKLIKPDGKLIILVPAYMFLYSRFDKELEHYRRYTRKKLKHQFKQSGLHVVDAFYFNFIGTLGWFFTGKILRRKTIPEGQMGLYNKLVPIFKIIDKILFRSMGLSVIVVGKK